MQHILPYADNTKKLAWEMARMAVRALYFEVKSYPKPGLVSFIDSGAHQDMNGETFYRSLFTLRHYFYQLVIIDLSEGSFEDLKQAALKAEERMLLVTKGVNTHRGAVFSLGLLVVSAARMLVRQKYFSPEDLQKKLIEDWKDVLQNHHGNEKSHGHTVLKKFADKKIITAKEMAIQGYPIIFNILPDFIDCFRQYHCMNLSCLLVYLHALMSIDDTNILYRKGWNVLQESRKSVSKILLLSCMKERQEKTLQLHKYFSKEGISPGGVGDLIGLCIFLGQLFSESMRCHY